MLQPPDDPAEKAENASGIPFRKRHATQEQAHVLLIRRSHFKWGILGCSHRLVNGFSQKVERSGGDSMISRARRNQGRRLRRAAIQRPCGQLVKTDGDRLAQVHRRLLWAGGNFDDHMAAGEVVSGKAPLFWSEDQGSPAAPGDFIFKDGCELGQRNRRLLGPASSQRGRAGHETAIGNSFGKAGALGRPFEHLWCANGGTGFAPMGCKGRNHGQTGKSEIGHGPGYSTNVEGVARRDQHHGETVALGERRQMAV